MNDLKSNFNFLECVKALQKIEDIKRIAESYSINETAKINAIQEICKDEKT